MAGNILGTLLLNLVTQANTSGLSKTDSALRKTSKQLQNTAKQGGFLRKALGALGVGINIAGIKNTFDAYLQFEKDVGAMKSRFFAITQDEKKAGEEFEWVRKLATDTAQDIKSTADSYSIFYSATQKALGTEGARDVFTNWSKVGRVLHLNEYQMERVTYALREMASKGAIYSQDLRMQIGTHVPNAMGLAQKAAEEMGITGTNWFEKLQSAAKGNAKVTADFVQKFSKQAQLMYGSETAFKKAMQQPDALAKQISNIGTNFMIKFSEAGGSYMIVKILQTVSDTLLKIDYDALAQSLGKIANNTSKIFNFLVNNISIIIKLLEFIAVGSIVGKAFGFISKFGKIFSINLLRNVFSVLAGARLGGQLGLGIITGARASLTGILGFVLKQGLGKIFGGIIGKALGFFGGPWGLVISIVITFLPQILGMLRKIFGKGNKASLSDTLMSVTGGITAQQWKTMSDSLATKNIRSQAELDRQLKYYKGGEKLVGLVDYKDNRTFTISIDGADRTANDIVNEIEARGSKPSKKGISLFNKPENKDIQFTF